MQNFFINRPIVAMVISLLTVIVGAITIASLPSRSSPPSRPRKCRCRRRTSARTRNGGTVCRYAD